MLHLEKGAMVLVQLVMAMDLGKVPSWSSPSKENICSPFVLHHENAGKKRNRGDSIRVGATSCELYSTSGSYGPREKKFSTMCTFVGKVTVIALRIGRYLWGTDLGGLEKAPARSCGGWGGEVSAANKSPSIFSKAVSGSLIREMLHREKVLPPFKLNPPRKAIELSSSRGRKRRASFSP